MDSGRTKSAIIVVPVMLIGLWLVAVAFGSGRNLMAAFAGYLPFAFGALGFFAPRISVYVLMGTGAFLGYIKKLLILDGRYGFETMYYVVGAPSLLLLGACAATAGRMLLKGTATRREVMMMVSFSLLSLLMIAMIYLKSGRPQLAIMGGAYVNVIWVLFLTIRERGDLRKLRSFTIFVLALSSLVGFYQWIFGLTELDMLYLQLGYETSVGEYISADPRPFATYGSSGQYGWAMVFGVAVCLSLMRGHLGGDRFDLGKKWFLIALTLFLVVAVFSSLKKAPMVGLVAFPFAILCVRNWRFGLAAFFFMITTVIFLIFQGDMVSDWLWDLSITLSSINPNLTVNSFNTRIRSFQEIGGEGIAWFGPGSSDAHSHTMITDVLLIVGYVPVVALMILGIVSYVLTQKRISRLVGSWKSPVGRDVAYMLGFFLAMLAGSLMGTGAYQAFPGSLFWWVPLGYAALIISWQSDANAARARQRADDPRRVGAMPRPMIGPTRYLGQR